MNESRTAGHGGSGRYFSIRKRTSAALSPTSTIIRSRKASAVSAGRSSPRINHPFTFSREHLRARLAWRARRCSRLNIEALLQYPRTLVRGSMPMAILLTCDCGARFEVEELLAGQEVSCPECQHALQVPARPTPPRTNLLALASVVLCLLGAFTILGTLAAAVLGVLAIVQINRDREHLTGTGFALFGIIGGLGFTA